MQLLIEMIKTGKTFSKKQVDDLFGNQQHITANAISYQFLVEYASSNDISIKELNDMVIKYGKSKLLLDALQTTKDCETFAEAWYRKSNVESVIKDYILYCLGYTLKNKTPIKEKEEKLVYNLFNYQNYKDLEIKEKIKVLLQSKYSDLKAYLEEHNSYVNHDLVKQFLKMNGLSFSEIEEYFDCIKDQEIYLDIMHSSYEYQDVNHMVQYMEKFGIDEDITKMVAKYVIDIKNNHTTSQRLSKETRFIIDEYYTKGYLKLYEGVLNSKSNAAAKLNLWLSISVFGNKEIRSKYKKDAKIIANQYLDFLGKQDIYTGNKRVYSHINADKFIGKLFEREIFDCLLEGRVQEYEKYCYVNPCLVQKQYITYFFGMGKRINWDNYYKSASYQKLPIPKEAFLNGDGFTFKLTKKPKYPCFIIARNALKIKKLDKSILADKNLYLQGFYHAAFRKEYDAHTTFDYLMSEEEFNSLLENNPNCYQEIDDDYDYQEEIEQFDQYQKMLEDSYNIDI